MKGTSCRRRRRRDTGQALVEMALVSPILLLMILGLIDFSRAWNIYQVITDAAREGARTVVVDSGEAWSVKRAKACNVVSAALARAGVDPDGAAVSIGKDITSCNSAPGPACTTGDPCGVTIEYDYTFGLIGPFWRLADPDGTVTLTTQAVMRTE